MLRTAPFHGSLARLAFIAVVLLASAPTISRWAASGSPAATPERIGICTVSGLEYIAVPAVGMPGATGADEGRQAPHRAPSGMDADCSYCPLLATTALPLSALTLPPAPMLANLVPAPRPEPRRTSPRFPGRGSRGPPLAL